MVQGLRPDFVLAFVLLAIAVILIAARIVGGLAVRVGQPRVVGEIIAGLLLGPSLLGATVFQWDDSWSVLQCDASRAFMPVGADPATFVPRAESITECLFPLQARGVLGIVGQIALIFFMFLVGLELDFASLKGKVKGIVTVAVGVVVTPIVVALAIGPVLYNDKFAVATDGVLPNSLGFSLFIAAMLAVTAFPVMARILQEKNLTTSAMGAIGVAAAAIVTVFMFLLVAVARGVAADKSAAELSLVFVGTVVYLGVMFGVVRPLLAGLGPRIEAAGKLTPPHFAIMVIVAFASAYAADRIGINVIVGAFVAGAIMPARGITFRSMADRLAEVTGTILLPIFLAFSGLNTDFTTLRWEFVPGILLLLVAAIAAKWGGGAVFARLGGLSWAEGNVLGILMNCRGLLVLVVALLARNEGIITPQMQVGGVLVALVTTAMTGPLFDRFLPSVAVAPSRAEAATAAMGAPAPVDETRVLAVIDDEADAALVVGAAYRTIGSARPAEAVLCRLFDLGTSDGLFASQAAEESEAVRSMRMLRALGSFPPEGVHVVPVTFGSGAPAADLVEIAAARAVDLVVVGAANPEAEAMARSLSAAGTCVVLYHDSGTGESRPGPVLLDGEIPEARRIAEAIAGALGSAVVADGDAAAMAAVVTGTVASPATDTPTYVVYPAQVPEPMLRGASAG